MAATGKGGWLVAIAWTIAFLALSWIGAGLLGFVFAWRITGDAHAVSAWIRTVSGPSILVQGVAFLLAALLATWLVGIKAAKLDLTTLRWRGTGAPLRGAGGGRAAGVLAAVAALLVAVIVTPSGWSGDAGGPFDYAASVARTGVVLAPAALAEEIVFRGVPLVLLAAAFGRGTALLIVAVVFALGHALNPHVSGLALGNIALASIFLGLVFYAPGGLWTAFGAHFGWNMTLAALDALVSGLPFRIPLLDYDPGGSALVTGGAFGPEGGLAATLALTVACLLVVQRLRKDVA